MLAPKTVVFIRKIALSTKVYSSAGIVERGPKNSAKVVKVPYSASNRSNSGVRAMMFMKAWKKPACTRGKVFVLYIVLNPISFGISAPHCTTSHTDCILKSQKAIMTKTIARVKRGRRKT